MLFRCLGVRTRRNDAKMKEMYILVTRRGYVPLSCNIQSLYYVTHTQNTYINWCLKLYEVLSPRNHKRSPAREDMEGGKSQLQICIEMDISRLTVHRSDDSSPWMWRAGGLFQERRQGCRRLRIANVVTTRYLVSVRWPSSFRLENGSNGTRSRGSTLTISHLEQSPTKITPWANSGEHLGGYTYQNERATNYTAQKKSFKSDLANESNWCWKSVYEHIHNFRWILHYPIPSHQNMLTLHFKWSQLIRLQTNPPLFG